MGLAIFNWVSAAFALLAAIFWFWSAWVPLPEKITSGYGGSGGSAQVLGMRCGDRLG